MNILQFHQYNEYFATIFAILANLLVVVLTITEKNATIRSYFKIIMATSINEFVFCLCSLLTVMVSYFLKLKKIQTFWFQYCQISNGAVVFVVGSVFHKVQDQTVHNILFFLYIFKIGIGINIIPAEYYFRYRTVCRQVCVFESFLSWKIFYSFD